MSDKGTAAGAVPMELAPSKVTRSKKRVLPHSISPPLPFFFLPSDVTTLLSCKEPCNRVKWGIGEQRSREVAHGVQFSAPLLPNTQHRMGSRQRRDGRVRLRDGVEHLVDLLRQLPPAGKAQAQDRARHRLFAPVPVHRPVDPGKPDPARHPGRHCPGRFPGAGRDRNRAVLPGQAVRVLIPALRQYLVTNFDFRKPQTLGLQYSHRGHEAWEKLPVEFGSAFLRLEAFHRS
jgi:hypothetical protein